MSDKITSMMREGLTFPPPASITANAEVSSLEQYHELWNRAKNDPHSFWDNEAKKLAWDKPYDRVLEWNEPFAQWFMGGKINASVNCLDRHAAGPRRNKAAIIWEGEPGEIRVLTYQMLLDEVCRFASALKLLDLKPGDRATIYMPMVPEVVIAMLACARIGVVHSVVFGGFSADAVADRTVDAGARIVITSDGGWRRGKAIPLKDNVDKALERCPNVEKCIVLRRTGQDISMTPGRDIWWHDLVNGVKAHCEPEILDAEHPLFLLYTSGSTGKPKGILHTTG
ncbi:MAG: AMP-binding protein, partial [Planctomycetota bacterium]